MLDKIFRLFFGFPHLMRRMQYPHILRRIKKAFPHPQGVSLLDIGCGSGELVEYLSTHCYSIGLEPRLLSAPIPGRCSFVQGSGFELPFSNEMFDIVIMSSVLQMVEDEAGLLRETIRVLKRQGRFILTVPVNYQLVPWFFKKNAFGGALRKVFRLPEDYDSFRDLLNKKHTVQGRGFYKEDQFLKLLESYGFKIVSMEYAPRRLGTILYEASLLLRWTAGVNLSVYGIFNFPLYVVGWFDRFLSPKSRGCEILVETEYERK